LASDRPNTIKQNEFLYIYIYIFGFFFRATATTAAAEVLCAGRGEVYNHEFPTGIHFRSRRLYCRRGYIFSSFLPRRFIRHSVRTEMAGREHTHIHIYIYYKSVASSRVVIYIHTYRHNTYNLRVCVCVLVCVGETRVCITATASSRRVFRESWCVARPTDP